MELNEMGVYATVVDLGSFTKAAEKLSMPKSTVSRHISQLESRLGVRLLNRTTRQLKPTEVGKLYFHHCARIIEEAEQAREVIQNMQAQPSGLLRITLPLAFGSEFMQYLIRDFLALHPKIKVEVVLDNRALDMLDEELDVAFRMGDLADSSLVARHIGYSHLILAATPEYLKENGTPKTLQELEEHHLIRHPYADMFMVHNNKKYEVKAQNRLLLNDMDLVRRMTLKDMGIGLLPTIVAADDLDAGNLVRVLPDFTSPIKNFYLVYAGRRQKAAKVSAFIDFALERIKESAPWDLPENWV
ncbi:MAG: LysR family transcriptional regulator [Bermanella sp.]